jgi:hypothetical protein
MRKTYGGSPQWHAFLVPRARYWRWLLAFGALVIPEHDHPSLKSSVADDISSAVVGHQVVWFKVR